MSPLRRLMTGSAVLATAAVASMFATGLVKDVQFARAEQKVEATREQLAQVEDLAHVFRTVGKVIEPSVVNITVTKSARQSARLPFDDELLRRFFPDRDGDGEPDLPDELEAPQQGTGSGVIMEVADGTAYVVTNNHVAGGATEMKITLHDGRVIDNAKVVGTDPKTDLAVVKIDAERVIAAKWGNSDDLQKGDWIMAFGSPFGYIGSMTHGIVSALNRHNIGILGTMGYENFIQVDAPINPGNSGGPLVNVRGEVVGINTAIASVTGSFAGVGFAIPSNQAKVVYQQLRDKGKIVRGYLGVAIDDVKNPRNPQAARVLSEIGYKGKEGIFVWQVPSDGPSQGVLEPGDVITQLNGKAVTDVQALRNEIAAMAPGTEAKLKIVRDGKDQEVTVKIGEQPEEIASAGGRRGGGRQRGGDAEERTTVETLGLRLSDFNDELAQKYGLTGGAGAVITTVSPNSPAQQAGLKVGDLLTRVGKSRVTNAKEAADALAKVDLSKGVTLHVTNRDGSKLVPLQTK